MGSNAAVQIRRRESSNVVLGKAVDMLIDAGGTAVLAETPEAIALKKYLSLAAVRRK